ncbi:MAG: chromosome segregation protein SMC [Acidothermus cellulolyticus]|nr:chromosome segregation protein SMC [Acidothermus cellulolyticus]
MYLKSLTLRGFKSFASTTTLRFEPGITCVVGPNGSGKSNIVDALAWVMGEQGAKSLRGGKMEDVIFAGTASRPPLGRAEVVVTIDNSDGALPIEYSEVTLSRIMFRNGGSEYAINGRPCRLLDIQELLSDSGIGREMHVIVGQGQLEEVLHATPEERRGFIEEAAGVLKHRKRKEKALRKLEAMQANLTRLADLTTELRRQLGPLGRQAETARKAARIQADLRDARLRLLADDLVTLRAELERDIADENAVRARRDELEQHVRRLRARETELEAALSTDAHRSAAAQQTWYRLSSLRERLRGTAELAAERCRQARLAQEETWQGRDAEQLDAEAVAARAEAGQLDVELTALRAALAEATERRRAAESALAAEEQRFALALRAAADRRETLARLAGEVAAQRTRVAAGEEEIGRLAAAAAEARARADRAQQEFQALESQIAGLDEGEVGLDADYERAAEALTAAEERLAALRERERELERARASLAARADALALSATRKDGAAALLDADVPGTVGAVARTLRIEAGYEAAVAAVLGDVANGVAVTSVDAALAGMRRLKEEDAGRTSLLIGGLPESGRAGAAPPDGRWLRDLVDAAPEFRGTLDILLRNVVVVDDLQTAHELVTRHPGLRVVTRDGDLLTAAEAAGGSATAPSLLEVQAALDDARRQLDEVVARQHQLRFEIAAAEQAREQAAAAADAALAQLHESDAAMAAIAEQLGHLGAQARAAMAEADRLAGSIAQAREANERDRERLAELERALAAAQAADDVPEEPSAEERDRLAELVADARAEETEARLAVGTANERYRAALQRAEELSAAAQAERAARIRAARQREVRRREAVVAAAVAQASRVILRRLERSLTEADAERRVADDDRAAREAELARVRDELRAVGDELEKLTDAVHRDEVARAELRLRMEQVTGRAMEEFGVDADTLVAEYGPHVPVPVAAETDATDGETDAAETVPYVRAEQEKRARSAERALAALGKVNPLALEEFAALEERHRFLSEQLEDLKKSRRDLLEIVREVDERVQEVFASAFADTAREFEQVFARLFPGGEGRLVLTEPNDLLTTGIDIEARPAGKKVKRLSLLSGGERSLTALAFLVALFKARPSPFYVVDEVEAALDETNLRRMLDIFEELRESSQLIIVTHQQPTMEIADALYGISMRGDGVSTVISQRLRDRDLEPQPA